MQVDTNGREYLKLADAEPNQQVELDAFFPCIPQGKVQLHGEVNHLYFNCKDGKHYISNQADDGIHCIGIYP